MTTARKTLNATAPLVVWAVDVQGGGAERFRRELLASMQSVRETTPGARLALVFGNLDADTLCAVARLGARLVRIKPATLARWQSWLSPSQDPRASVRTWPAITLARLYLPLLLPDEPRAIYIDADTLAVTSLVELWRTDLGGKEIGACLAVADELGYNSGCLVLDLDGLRRLVDWRTFEAFAEKRLRRFRFPDQTLLNKFFEGRIAELPQKWQASPRRGADPATLAGAGMFHFFECAPPFARDAFTEALLAWQGVYARAIAACANPAAVAPSATPPPSGAAVTVVDWNPATVAGCGSAATTPPPNP